MTRRCPHCGEGVEGAEWLHECDQVAGWVGTGRCPMCSEPYDSWLDHLKECEPN